MATRPFEVFFKTPTRMVPLDVRATDSILHVKELLAKRLAVDVSTLRLIFAGQQLDDEGTIVSFNIQKENTVHVVPRLQSSASPDDGGADNVAHSVEAGASGSAGSCSGSVPSPEPEEPSGWTTAEGKDIEYEVELTKPLGIAFGPGYTVKSIIANQGCEIYNQAAVKEKKLQINVTDRLIGVSDAKGGVWIITDKPPAYLVDLVNQNKGKVKLRFLTNRLCVDYTVRLELPFGMSLTNRRVMGISAGKGADKHNSKGGDVIQIELGDVVMSISDAKGVMHDLSGEDKGFLLAFLKKEHLGAKRSTHVDVRFFSLRQLPTK